MPTVLAKKPNAVASELHLDQGGLGYVGSAVPVSVGTGVAANGICSNKAHHSGWVKKKMIENHEILALALSDEVEVAEVPRNCY